jgi:hypothetical protein
VASKGSWLSADVRAWASSVHRHLGSDLYDNLGLTAAAAAPMVRRHHLAVVVRFAAWIYLLDDRLDDAAVGVAEVRRVGQSVRAVLASQEARSDDHLEAGLANIVADLGALDRDPAVMARFTEAVRDGVDAAVAHAELSRRVVQGAVDPPSAEDYLDVAARHINYRSLAFALFLVVGQCPSRTGLEEVDKALLRASRAVRLANDLRTAPKDRSEGSLNLLDLRFRDGRAAQPEDVVAQIRRDIGAHNKALRAVACRELVTTCRVLTASLRLAIGAYRLADLKQGDAWPGQERDSWWATPVDRRSLGGAGRRRTARRRSAANTARGAAAPPLFGAL